jgi:Activator of Hsp90 ATPase homolog 1-like protein
MIRKEKKMIDREQYTPGPARGAQVRKDGEKWTLILVRDLRHSPEKVWQALTDPAHLREWAPFDDEKAEYAKQFGIETPNKPPQAAQKP